MANMEVHHAHHPTHKKNWKEYSTEFLMLSLAVTLGFFAENVREIYVEKERSHEYINRFEADLRNNLHVLDSILATDQHLEYGMDSALVELAQSENEFDLEHFFANVHYGFPRFLNKNDTYEQMKSSGSLRYIKDHHLLDLMIEYTAATEAAEYRSREQEASYVLGQYSNLLTKWYPHELSMKGYYKAFQSHRSRISTPDSIANLIKKLEHYTPRKSFVIRGETLEKFKEEIIPATTRRIGLMRTTMLYLSRSKKKAEELLTYLKAEH